MEIQGASVLAKKAQKKQKIIAILIAYNAEKTLGKFYGTFPKHLVDDIFLVDDRSSDGTFALSKKLGITSYQNPVNLGYGGNLKRAIALALEKGADIIIDLHPDGEYGPNAIAPAIAQIGEGAALVLGRRWNSIGELLERGMYWWKLPFLMGMTAIHQIVLGTRIKDLHQGFRVYTRKLLEQIPFEKGSNNYLLSFEIITQSFFRGLPVVDVPVEAVYTGKKRGATLQSSIRYTLGTFKTLSLFLLAKLGVPIGIFKLPKGTITERMHSLAHPQKKKLNQE